MTLRPVVPAAALLALLALSGCTTVDGSAPSSAPTAEDQAESTPQPAAPCDAARLTVTVQPDADLFFFQIAASNDGANYCTLQGSPSITPIGTDGVALDLPTATGTDGGSDSAAPDAVELNPGGVAYALVTYQGNDLSDCTPSEVAAVDVTLPGSDVPVRIGDLAITVYSCDGAAEPIDIRPFTPQPMAPAA